MIKFYIWEPAAAAGRSGRTLPPLAPGVRAVRFGPQTILYVDEEPPPHDRAARARRSGTGDPASGGAVPTGETSGGAARGARLPQRYEDTTLEELHVVVQKGRLFQQHHPDVRVFHDRGRFLLVGFDPQRTPELTDPHGTSWGIRRLAPDHVVFDAPEPPARRAATLAVKESVDALQRRRFEADVAHLAGLHTRHSTSEGFMTASDWARTQLADLGYATRFQDLEIDGRPSRNLVAEPPGSVRGREVVLVTAHLDSIHAHGGPRAAAPGADDNASGSAGVLEIARVLRDRAGRRALRLILFGGEEQGLWGSKRYVAELAAAERSRIRAVVNLDMIGRVNAAPHTVLLEGAPVSVPIIDGLRAAAVTYTALAVETSLHPYASDHVPFIDAGIPAVLTIEGADGANPDIHSERDTIDRVDAAFSLEILRMIVGFVAEALDERTPAPM